MKPTLFDLWNGNLCPVKEYCQNNKEVENLERLLKANADKLSEELNEKQTKRFNIYNQCVEEYLQCTNEEAFYKGFSLAYKIINEANTQT